ncbi:MAG TPA: TonB family protein [Phycisphaerae bacterium]|nr:TonB family protein [Phycisphaerae bacterium]
MFLRQIAFFGLLCGAAAWAQSIEGVVFDCTGGVVPGARVLLTENYALKTETMTGSDGRFTFQDVRPNRYQILVKKERFALAESGAMVREDRPTRLNFVLQPDRVKEGSGLQSQVQPSAAAARPAQPYVPPLGGQVQFMKMLRPPRPAYPEKAAQAGIAGQVVFFVRGKADGSVEILSVLASPDPELEAAARQAVGQMRCEPTKVNGKAVDWDFEFTVDFRLPK